MTRDFIQKFSTSNFFYNKVDNTFSAEASEIAWPGYMKEFMLVNPKTKASKKFTHYKTDKDGSGEDTYGWRYRTDDGIKLLIIND